VLSYLDSDDDGGGEAGSGDTSFRFRQKTAACLAPIALTDDENMSAVLFWKRHCDAYPFLSEIAKIYLTLSSSSVPVDSMFSVTGLIKNSRRSSIAPHRLNRLRFVHDNYDKFFPVK
jgi:hypothetical protein